MDSTADTLRVRPIALAATLFATFFLLLPLAVFVGLLPISLLPAGDWIYVVTALLTCLTVAARPQLPGKRRIVAIWVSVALLSCVLPVAGGLAALDAVFGDFGEVEVLGQSVSPSGRLTLIHEYYDQGALGGSHAVYVKGRLIPGVIEWSHSFWASESPEDVGWHDSSSVFIDGSVHRVPLVMLLFAW